MVVVKWCKLTLRSCFAHHLLILRTSMAASSAHAFERRYLASQAQSVAAADGPAPWDDSSDSDVAADVATTPGGEFVKYMIGMLMYSTLSAKQFCTAMWWASRAGVEEAKPYAFRPDAPSGHYSRKVKAALGWSDTSPFYPLDIPGHGKHDLERAPHTIDTLPLHEQLVDDLEGDPACRLTLAQWRVEGRLPPAYWQHPVTQDAREEAAMPFALYLDGVPYSLTDSVLGMWGVNLVTGKRFLFAALRKRLCCQCGCRGWCTLHPLFASAAWSLRALAAGIWPTRRHDGSPFLRCDEARARRAGEAMRTRWACLYIKGDWAEYAGSLGLPPWNDALRPCYECPAFGAAQYIALGNSMTSLRWDINDESDYDRACRRCEIIVEIATEAEKTMVSERLRPDKRDGGARGLGLASAPPPLSCGATLHADDRLEPSEQLLDYALFREATPPFTVTFWRHSEETLARHRNPLFWSGTGVTPTRCITTDTLHCFYLGVLKVWCTQAVWLLLESDVYGHMGTAEERLASAVLVLRAALMRFYKQRHRDHPTEQLTQLSDLTPKMLGSRVAKRLKTKGAETWGFALFALAELRCHLHRLPPLGARLLRAGENLERLDGIWRRSEWVMQSAHVEDPLAL